MSTNCVFRIARFVLEATTPLSIGTGSPDGVFDTALVRDANGLPAIPGSSLAGVLRHLYQSETDEEKTNDLFGYQARGTLDEDNGSSSRIQVAWGCILDSEGMPVEGLALDKKLESVHRDPILGPLLEQVDKPVTRNRVRIGARGAAADTGKFDRAVLPAGHRFACELVLFGDDEKYDRAWGILLDLLRDPRLRLGGATRSGLGRMKLRRLHTGRFDLSNSKDAHSFREIGVGIADRTKLKSQDCSTQKPPKGWLALELRLQARDFWRIGQGVGPLGDSYAKEPDETPVTEERVHWNDDWQARRLLALPLIPGSSIKGVLAHRVAFYANCLQERWADEIGNVAGWDKDNSDDETKTNLVREIFGNSKQKPDEDKSSDQAGHVFIDDADFITESGNIAQLMHNAIDRFTGGVRDHLLFSEEVLWRTELSLDCLINTSKIVDDVAKMVLRLALEDLVSGRLSIGAGFGKGHGLFEGSIPHELDQLYKQGSPS